jgi:hypothetical protein
MHEGGHGILENLHHEQHSHDPHHHGPAFGSQLRRGAKFFFPALLLASIIISAIPRFASVGTFELAILPMLVGGGYITWSTVVAVIETRKITAGTMVVLALVGTAYVGEYLAGAVVAFMMIAGEFLEDFTLEKTRNAVREIVKLVPATATVKTGDITSEVATGKNSYGVNFQRFVLGALLDDVLYRASQRLQVMSKGRFTLHRAATRTDMRCSGGLDLEVQDSYTDTSRLVATLAGGESFLASLALALGLADVVQAYAGGIRLDTVFVDEGFGSLDPESLDLALRALIDLQTGGRLVGIISHVPELKERIDVRLEVSAGQQGSTARFCVDA